MSDDKMSDDKMSDDKITNRPAPNQPIHRPTTDQATPDPDGYEHEDLSPSGPFYFFAGLVLLVLVIYLIAFGMFRFLDSYESTHQPPVSPMATPEADTRTMTHEETQAFPQPRLEENERTELRSLIENEDRELATYDWVDKDKGIVRIPIARAMELIVQHGLPVHAEGATSTQSSAAQTAAPVKKQSPKVPAKKAAASRGSL
jgi:hypothetical protein